MIAYIKGILAHSTPQQVIIETRGIGYQIFIPASAFSKLPQLNEEIILYTSFIVRELSHTLYGFISIQDRDLFEALLNVTGIGPKIALSIIGHLTAHELHQSILNHHVASLSKVPGVGKKTAERLIMELRDKIGTLLHFEASEFAVHSQSDPKAQQVSDAMSALVNLGYNQMTAQKAIKKTLKEMPETISLSELITLSLKNVN